MDSLEIYDEVIYHDEYFPNTHPSNIAAIATLYGLSPQNPRKCRMLELGAANGNNLIEISSKLPSSEFIGIDFSAKQVEIGQKRIAELGITNFKLEHKNILDIGSEYGKFDYIIAHGILSWVPDIIKNKMFEICRDLLTENGICYFSFNTYPGWKARDIFRDIMLTQSENVSELKPKVGTSRQALELINQLLSENNSDFSKHLKQELKHFIHRPDWYFIHDFLAEENRPFYISEIFKYAEVAELQYLADTELSMNSVLDLPPESQKILHSLRHDTQRFEQFSDIARLRSFRRSLFCRKNLVIDRNFKKSSILKLTILAELDISRVQDTLDQYKFSNKVGGAIISSEPALIKTLEIISSNYPNPVPVSELLENLKTMGLADKEDILFQGLIRGILGNILEIKI